MADRAPILVASETEHARLRPIAEILSEDANLPVNPHFAVALVTIGNANTRHAGKQWILIAQAEANCECEHGDDNCDCGRVAIPLERVSELVGALNAALINAEDERRHNV